MSATSPVRRLVASPAELHASKPARPARRARTAARRCGLRGRRADSRRIRSARKCSQRPERVPATAGTCGRLAALTVARPRPPHDDPTRWIGSSAARVGLALAPLGLRHDLTLACGPSEVRRDADALLSTGDARGAQRARPSSPDLARSSAPPRRARQDRHAPRARRPPPSPARPRPRRGATRD